MVVNPWKKCQEHITQLCRKNGIGLRRGADYDFELDTVIYEADIYNRYIVVSDINCMNLYISALHELGHCLDMRAQYSVSWFTPLPPNTVYGEYYAWEYAIKNSILPIDDGAYDYMACCLKNYAAEISRLYRKWKKPRAKNYQLLCSYMKG